MAMKGKITLGAVVGFVVIAVVSANAGSNGASTRTGSHSAGSGTGTGTGTHSSAAARPDSAGKKKAAFAGDGDFRVGTDIAPGTYRSTGNTDGSCYGERAKDADHSLDSVIANDNVTGTAVVTVAASDAYFKTTGCQDWKKA